MTTGPRRDLATVGASVVGLSPGLLLPFAVSFLYALNDSDLMFLALSLSLVMMNVVVAAIEANTVAAYGRFLSEGTEPHFRELRHYAVRSLVRSLPVIVLGIPLIFLTYASRDGRWYEAISLTALLMAVPIMGCFTAIPSGALIAHGRAALAIATQGLRSALPLLVLLVAPGSPLLVIAAFYVVGEIIRFIVLFTVLKRIRSNARKSNLVSDPMDPRGLLWQISATGVSQANPVVDRFFLAGAGSGDITSYELADKIYFSIYQLIYSGMVLRRLGRWSTFAEGEDSHLFRQYRRDIGTLVAVAAVLVVLMSTLLIGATTANLVPLNWEEGVLWSLIILPSAPLSIIMITSMRFLVVLGEVDFRSSMEHYAA